jgi:lysophospholipase L1-like esterase
MQRLLRGISWSRIRRTTLLLFALMLIGEVSLRVIFGFASPVLIKPDKSENEGGYGYIPAPDQDVRRFFAHIKINHFSMRSDDISPNKAKDHIRVYFIGDSVTYGVYIDQSRIFTTILLRDLPERLRHPVDILNASAGGWAPGNEVGFLKKNGTFDADLVLIVLNTGDLNQPFADFQPHPGFTAKAPWTAIGEAWTRLVSIKGIATGPGATATQPTVMMEETAAILATLGRGREYALSHNARFGIVYIPLGGKLWDGADFQLGKTMLVDWAKQNGVLLVDLTQSFEGHSLDELYLERGDARAHLSAAGHRIVAARLLDALPAILNSSAPALEVTP